MWSEVHSVVHEAVWRNQVTTEQAIEIRNAFAELEVEVDKPEGVYEEAWKIADELGWAKTYDAEYVALARMRKCRLVTTDLRLRRGAGRFGMVFAPDEL